MVRIMASEPANVAHILRRLTFGPLPGAIARLRSRDMDEIVDGLLGRADDDGSVRGHLDHALTELPDNVLGMEWDDFTRWWLNRMAEPTSGLHEKMVWFWHGHFTSTPSKTGDQAMVNQHNKLRQHALGNFRSFVKAMVTDGAMLSYLDAAGSNGAAPNENLSRELLELFTLGRGNYNESDVREGAKILAGYWVDWETGEPEWDENLAYRGVVRFMGQQGRITREQMVDIIVEQPSCAPFIAAKLHRYLVGTEPDTKRTAELAEVFRSNDFEILPLIEAIVDHASFAASETHANRPRYAIEWFVAASAVLNVKVDDNDLLWMLDGMGQRPGYPPNVAGWPEGDRWISAAMQLLKSNVIFNVALNADDGKIPTFSFDESDAVNDALELCGLFDPSKATFQALEEAYWSPFDADEVNLLLVHLCLTSPEFSLA